MLPSESDSEKDRGYVAGFLGTLGSAGGYQLGGGAMAWV